MGRRHTTEELMVFRWSWFVKTLNTRVIVQLTCRHIVWLVLGEVNEYEIAETAKKRGQSVEFRVHGAFSS